MSAPQENSDGNNPLPNLAALSVDGLNPGQRRLALARAARENATPEEIEAQGIRGDVQQIIRHMNRTPSHAAKRARRNGLGTARKIYEDDSDDEEDGDDLGQDDEEEREEDWFELQWQAMLAKEGLQNANMFVLAEFRQIAHERIGKLKQGTAEWRRATTQPPPKKSRFDLLTSLCTCNELIVEVCKRMRPVDIINLYSISKVFRTTLDNNMRSCIFAWASHMAPTSARIFSSPVYYRWFIEDPAKRLVTAADRELGLAQPGQARLNGQPPLNDDETKVRLIPGLLWLQMVVHREIRVRDIIATLARKGHRLPEGSHLTLKKIWVIMDASTTATRIHLLNNSDFFSDEDLYIAQLFMVKLVLAFNHPNFGPQSSMLMRLMMGQRGLSPLWKLLRGKQYRTLAEIRELKLRYDVDPAVIDAQQGMPLHGVEVDELGTMHFEGWGSGPNHLMRPDELIPLEAARRQLDLDRYVEDMMLFGHVDLTTGNSLVPSLEEMYMSDDELPPAQSDWKSLKQELIHSGCGNVPFERGMWQPKHARKARWKTLSDEEKAAILEAEEEEIEEVKQLDGAYLRYQTARAKLLKMTMEINSLKKGVKDKYKLLSPSPQDLQDQLYQFDQPKRLQLAINESIYHNSPDPDTMDVDFKPDSIVLHAAKDPDDLSTIPDEDLDLEPIPQAELRRIFAAFRPANSPRDIYSDTDSYPNSEYGQEEEEEQLPEGLVVPFAPMGHAELLRQIQILNDTQPEPQPDQNGNENDTESLLSEIDETQFESDEEALMPWIPSPQQEPDFDLPNPPVICQNPELYLQMPVSLKPELVDKMLLAQADEAYSDDEFDGQGLVRKWDVDNNNNEDRGQRRAADGDGYGGETMAEGDQEGQGQGQRAEGDAGHREMDWNDFLNNPGAYVLGLESGSRAHGAQLEGVDNDGEDMEGWDADGEDDGMPEDEIEDEEEEEEDEEDEEDGEVDINVLVQNLHGGLDLNDDQQQDVVLQEAEQFREESELDSTLYIADEDVGEDERTRKLRDWFRPW